MSPPIVEHDVEDLVQKLTLQEKAALTAGRDFWHTTPIYRLKIPSLRFTDGPNGARGTQFFNSVPAACLPCGTALGATWDSELVEAAGRLLGEETRAKGAHAILAPTMNIQRSPLGGRGFESFAEDPVLSGVLAGHYCLGVQAEKAIATPKHFVCNDQEHERMGVNSIVTERAMREIYLLPFQIALRIANPGAIMTAYNRINGCHASENPHTLQDILRKEWGWDGLVMSDWFGTYSTSEAINAGLDIEMPGPTRWRGSILEHSVVNSKVPMHILDERVKRILKLINLTAKSDVPSEAKETTLNRPQDHQLLRELAAQSIVLLKNDERILPFDREKSVAVIGPNSKIVSYSGGGSAGVNAMYLVSPFDGVRAKSRDRVGFSQGVYGHKNLPDLGPLMETPEGHPGFIMRVYNEPHEDPHRICIDELHLKTSTSNLADYSNERIKSDVWYADCTGTFAPEESGIYDFGVVVIGSGKLYIDEEFIVDNSRGQRRGHSFFGHGTTEVISSKRLEAGRKYSILFRWGSTPTGDLPVSPVAGKNGAFHFSICRRLDYRESIGQAAKLAAQHDQVVIFAGLNSEWESEGYDRQDMALPPGTDELIKNVIAANPKTVVCIQSGTPVEMPWADDTRAILQAWYGGCEAGNGIADVLYGDVNPSGKLPMSFPKRVQDNPAYLNFGSDRGRVLYGEDVFVGYRYYDKTNKNALLCPFGHGLSYTTFECNNLAFNKSKDRVLIMLDVKNAGPVKGKETVQLYIAPVYDCSVNRPVHELKAFRKVELKPGHVSKLRFELEVKRVTCFFDEIRNEWVSEKGTYEFVIKGSGTKELKGTFDVDETTWWTGL